ncbi:MAG: hypothetical protein SOV36_07385 [Anaerostipes faecalis]|nr:hypothetical protein [Anaerostipes faecalis]
MDGLKGIHNEEQTGTFQTYFFISLEKQLKLLYIGTRSGKKKTVIIRIK